MIKVPSPAKLNLFLHITGRRENGYHELQTIFQLIDLYDWIIFKQTTDDVIHIEGLTEVKIEQNLIYRAAQLLRPHAQKLCGLNIRIEKISLWVRDWGGLLECRNHAYCTQSTLAMRTK